MQFRHWWLVKDTRCILAAASARSNLAARISRHACRTFYVRKRHLRGRTGDASKSGGNDQGRHYYCPTWHDLELDFNATIFYHGAMFPIPG